MRKNLSKKVVGLTLTTAMIASLTACNSSTSNDPTQPSTKGTDTETTSQAEQQSETTTEETTTEEETVTGGQHLSMVRMRSLTTSMRRQDRIT